MEKAGARALAWLGAAVAVALLVQGTLEITPHTTWGDRDLVRGDRFWQDLPWTGAELGYGVGARVPGPGWYALLAALRGVGLDAEGVYGALRWLDVGALVLLGRAAWRALGPVGAAATMLVAAAPSEARWTISILYNPSGVPVFLAVAHAALAAALATGRASWWGLWSFALLVGGQLHVTAAAWWAWTLVGLAPSLRAAAPSVRRAIAAGAALSVAPYVLGELTHGLQNTRWMLVQDPVRDAAFGWGLDLAELVEAVGVLTPYGGAGLVALGLAAVGAWASLREGGSPWARAMLAPVAAAVLTPTLLPSVIVEERYLFVAVMGFAVVAGQGAAALAAWRPAAGGAAVAALALALAPGLAPTRTSGGWMFGPPPADGYPGNWTARRLDAVLTQLQARDGTSMADVVGRTAVFMPEPGGWMLRHGPPAAWALHLRGETFAGSGAPPCWALTDGPPPDAAALGRAIGQEVLAMGAPMPLDWPSSPPIVATTYVPVGGLCPTTLTNRYLDLPGEEALRRAWPDLAPDGHAALPAAPGGWRRAGVHHESPGRRDGELFVAVDLALEGGPRGVSGVLHVPQLRGWAANAEWFVALLGRDPVLRLVDGAREVVVPVASGPVGMSGVVSPFRVAAAVPPGTWSVTFEVAVSDTDNPESDWRTWQADPVQVRVPLGVLVVDGGGGLSDPAATP